MNIRYAQDYVVGDIFDLGTFELSKDEIIEFSRKYDPFPFHVDKQAAKQTVFEGIISSGWLTALIWLHSFYCCRKLLV